jgi:hypothetical protein
MAEKQLDEDALQWLRLKMEAQEFLEPTKESVTNQPLKKPIMRKQFKQVFRGLAELAAIFTAIFVIPAILAALVNLNVDVYFNCVQHPGYDAVMSVIGIIFCLVYTSMYQTNEEV